MGNKKKGNKVVYELVKLLMDLGISLCLLILTSPILILLAVLVRSTTPGSAFFKQIRVGTHGKLFTLYKFRTMYKDADKMKDRLSHLNEKEGPIFKIRRDPRVTPLGRFLRQTSLDELPQLFNILKGDMSLVGPRPHLPEEIKKYTKRQLKRLSVKPGITSLWAISGRSHLSFRRWMAMDIRYIEKRSLSFDIYILLKTIPTVITGSGAW